MGQDFGRNVTEIAAALIGVALVALLVSNAGGATKIIESTGQTFGGLLRIVTLQGGGNGFANFANAM